MTRMPTPSTLAVVSDSTSPSNTSTSVSRVRTTYASTCSPSRAVPRDGAGDVEQLAATHAAVPPTVISRTSTVGWPDDTGTL